MKQSKLFKLGFNDMIKGLIVTIIMVSGSSLTAILSTGAVPSVATLKIIGLSSIGAGLSYLIKNIFTNSNGEIAAPEEKK
jgi:hypothetical protein